jgi:hypothetical protein
VRGLNKNRTSESGSTVSPGRLQRNNGLYLIDCISPALYAA